MRTSTIPIVAALLVVGSSRSLAAQELHRDSIPPHYSLLSDRPAARVLRFVGPPGAKSPMHAHPPHFAYVIRGGRVRFTSADGQGRDVPLQTGQRFDIPQVLTHAVEVTGTDTVVVLLVEYWQDSSLMRRSPQGTSLYSSPPNKHLH